MVRGTIFLKTKKGTKDLSIFNITATFSLNKTQNFHFILFLNLLLVWEFCTIRSYSPSGPQLIPRFIPPLPTQLSFVSIKASITKNSWVWRVWEFLGVWEADLSGAVLGKMVCQYLSLHSQQLRIPHSSLAGVELPLAPLHAGTCSGLGLHCLVYAVILLRSYSPTALFPCGNPLPWALTFFPSPLVQWSLNLWRQNVTM